MPGMVFDTMCAVKKLMIFIAAIACLASANEHSSVEAMDTIMDLGWLIQRIYNLGIMRDVFNYLEKKRLNKDC